MYCMCFFNDLFGAILIMIYNKGVYLFLFACNKGISLRLYCVLCNKLTFTVKPFNNAITLILSMQYFCRLISKKCAESKSYE